MTEQRVFVGVVARRVADQGMHVQVTSVYETEQRCALAARKGSLVVLVDLS